MNAAELAREIEYIAAMLAAGRITPAEAASLTDQVRLAAGTPEGG